MNDNSRSTTARCMGGRSPVLLTERQKSVSRFCASVRPPRANPSVSMIAFMAPEDVPDTPSITEAVVAQEMFEHAPGEGAMRPAALQRQIDTLAVLRTRRRGLAGRRLAGAARFYRSDDLLDRHAPLTARRDGY